MRLKRYKSWKIFTGNHNEINAANINHFSNIDEFQGSRDETTEFRKLVLLFVIIAVPGETKDLSEKNPDMANEVLAVFGNGNFAARVFLAR